MVLHTEFSPLPGRKNRKTSIKESFDIFLILSQTEAVLTSTHNLCFEARKM